MKRLCILILVPALLFAHSSMAFVLYKRPPSAAVTSVFRSWPQWRHRVLDNFVLTSLISSAFGGFMTTDSQVRLTGAVLSVSGLLGAGAGAPTVSLLFLNDLDNDHPLCQFPRSVRQAIDTMVTSEPVMSEQGQMALRTQVISDALLNFALQFHDRHLSREGKTPPESIDAAASFNPEPGGLLFQVVPVNGSHWLVDLSSQQTTQVLPASVFIFRDRGSQWRFISSGLNGELISCLLTP